MQAIRGSRQDASAMREQNAKAPRIPDFGRRIRELFHPYRGRLALTIVLVLVTAGLTVAPPLLTQEAFDQGLFPGGGPNLPRLAEIVGGMVLIWVVSQVLGVGQTYLTATIGNGVTASLRQRLFTRLQQMELGFFTRTRTGVIQSRLANDVGGVANVLSNTVSSVVGNTVTVIAAFVAMFLLSWQLALIAIVLLPILAVVQRRVGQRRARIATQTQESLSELSAITQEALSVSGILLAKAFTQQRHETERYAAESRKQLQLQVRQEMSGQGFFAMVQIFLLIVPAVVYLVSGVLLSNGVAITAGTIVAFTTVQARLTWPLMGLLRVALDLQTSSALFARIFEYLDLQPAITDRADAVPVPQGPALGRVEFDGVGFAYPGGPGQEAVDILRDVSFTVEPGASVALVGPSGAGKTTIGYLVPRLYDATSGSVRFAGVDVKDLQQESLLATIGIVSQETYLFHATIRENLRYAKPDATDEEIRAAAAGANLHDTIERFPDGYDTVVGERGYRLSGGEKQRIAIARVLLKNPPVVVLDEATSALDSMSERVVQDALDAASAGRTTIAIAHRLSTVVDADEILVLDAGRIVERGTHLELLRLGGLYAKLAAEQLAEEEAQPV
ncbi:ABC transporter ATP-binding protein [Amnibacterium kyonggiense]|uniref:Fatty acid ABC transporter ATP-binding/permease protein n=1 Tax=Amnibacterium kyonggiense TaxID=595671 RepID=A0A4R7FP80_9MICO|nr:ABC transporter ATP-binding protein [Amnibacterium kyonggiense]TDS79540.1 ATP-binding cassette subfamily B protein [Amnibacterium kyonggiense]